MDFDNDDESIYRLLMYMYPSAYQSPSIEPEFSGLLISNIGVMKWTSALIRLYTKLHDNLTFLGSLYLHARLCKRGVIVVFKLGVFTKTKVASNLVGYDVYQVAWPYRFWKWAFGIQVNCSWRVCHFLQWKKRVKCMAIILN